MVFTQVWPVFWKGDMLDIHGIALQGCQAIQNTQKKSKIEEKKKQKLIFFLVDILKMSRWFVVLVSKMSPSGCCKKRVGI